MRRLAVALTSVTAVLLLTAEKGCSSSVGSGPDYATISCADWANLDNSQKLEAAQLYTDSFNDPKGHEDAPTLVTSIGTTCDAYGDKETPAHIASVEIRSVYGG